MLTDNEIVTHREGIKAIEEQMLEAAKTATGAAASPERIPEPEPQPVALAKPS
jgi:hypothetical protein